MTFEQSKVNGTYFYGVDMNLLKNYNQKYYRDNYESGYFNQINSVADNFVIVNDEKLASVHSCFDLLNRVAMKSDPLSAYGQGGASIPLDLLLNYVLSEVFSSVESLNIASDDSIKLKKLIDSNKVDLCIKLKDSMLKKSEENKEMVKNYFKSLHDDFIEFFEKDKKGYPYESYIKTVSDLEYRLCSENIAMTNVIIEKINNGDDRRIEKLLSSVSADNPLQYMSFDEMSRSDLMHTILPMAKKFNDYYKSYEAVKFTLDEIKPILAAMESKESSNIINWEYKPLYGGFNPKVFSVKLDIKNPMTYDFSSWDGDEIDYRKARGKIIKNAFSSEHDGVVFKNSLLGDEVIVFSHKQIFNLDDNKNLSEYCGQ